ncbi:MAG: hypothetical protein ACLQIB_52380 [Isosphaeraceae bacterium]
MQRDRLSVAAPMALIVVVSVELAALNWGTGVAVDITRLLTIIFLVAATCLARYRTGGEGAWWFGFALFGWAYYVLLLDAMARFTSLSSQSIVSFLPALIMDSWTRGSRVGPAVIRYLERLRILHEMFILGAAIIGGGVFWAIERRHRPERPEEPSPG